MREITHTLGPWTYNDQSPNRVIGPEGETVAATYSGNIGSTVQLANTHLISHAPTMYGYIKSKASSGDHDAIKIVSEIEGANS